MKTRIGRLSYLGWWFVRARFFGRQKPLQTVLFITNACNLRCKHCALAQDAEKNGTTNLHKSYEQIKEELEYSYNLGSRFVDFEGGEPTMWRGQKEGRTLTVNDLIALAKEIGFYSCTITTNAQTDFAGSAADSIWVSLDGVGPVHDDIRGNGAFAKLEKNIAACGHPAVSVNMTVNNRNYTNVEEAIRYVKANPNIRLISFGFHTPYAGTEHLFLDWQKRADVIDRIIEMKRQGYPIMNSVSGLKLMKTARFKKQCWVSNFILPDGTRLTECTGKTAGVCDQCGFGMAGEMRSVFDFKIDTLLAGMHLRM
ncbi:MAG: radical SAM protein [Bacteroidales bacterium]|nr:radical SAM protein [Bacteroidales bacterium]